MAILGQIIKSAISLSHSFAKGSENAAALQQQQLYNLIENAENTSFGIYYGFSQLLKKKDIITAYRAAVPIYDYHTMNERWWNHQQKYPNISWTDQPSYFARSSGTTGKKSKQIPITDDMLQSFRKVGISQALSLANFDFPAAYFEKEVLMLSSSANLDKNGDHLEGEISGINTSNLPPWFGGFYRPGPKIAEIDNWEKRIAKIAKEAPKWDIVAMAGIPSWIQIMLKEIIDYNKLKNIHEIWPNLSIYLSGGVAFEPYRESLETLFEHPLTYLDTYLASEGFFAYTARPNTMAMKLALEHGIFYEFIPFDETGFDETGQLLENPKVLSIDEVEENKDYALIVSTPAGAWRYIIGDTIKFTDLENHEIIISGRTKYFLNVVGSQLSEEKINDAIQEVSNEFSIQIHEFAVTALQRENEEFIHQWVIGLDQDFDESQIKNALDKALKERNKNYGVAREKALKDIQVRVVKNEKLYDWLAERKKKGGQVKLPKVMKSEMMKDLLETL
jgi:hypothetical protein